MAGCSLIFLFFAWPALLLIGLVWLFVQAAAVIVTSMAFPVFILSACAGILGTIDGVRILWRHFKEPSTEPLTMSSFRRMIVLYIVSFFACVIAIFLAGAALLAAFA
jgi:hypothetical protein